MHVFDELEDAWEEDTPQEEQFTSIVIYLMVLEGKLTYPPAIMMVRGSDVYMEKISDYDDDGNKTREYEKVGRVISDDATGLVLEADVVGRISLKISITGETAVVDGKISREGGCFATWQNELKRAQYEAVELPKRE